MTAMRKLWTGEHQRLLRQARQDAGLSDVSLARENAITLRHLQQLEEGGTSAFYSESIKYDTGAKLLKRLGVEPPVATDMPDVAAPLSPGNAPPPDTSLAQAPSTEEPPDPVSSADSLHLLSRTPYIVMSLAGLALIGAGISLIPSIHQPGATQGVVQATGTAVAAVESSSQSRAELPGDGSNKSVETVSGNLPAGPTSPTPATQATIMDPCGEAGVHQTIVPSQPSKSADYVYLTAVSDVVLCVRDAAGQITRKSLSGGQSFNIPGRQPFEVTADHLDQLRVFFQGQRIWFQAGTTRLRLTAATAGD